MLIAVSFSLGFATLYGINLKFLQRQARNTRRDRSSDYQFSRSMFVYTLLQCSFVFGLCFAKIFGFSAGYILAITGIIIAGAIAFLFRENQKCRKAARESYRVRLKSAVSPEKQATFWDLSSEDQFIHLRALDDAKLSASDRDAIFSQGAMLYDLLTVADANKLDYYRDVDLEVLHAFFPCNARSDKHGGKCTRPAGHLDGLPLDFHSYDPYKRNMLTLFKRWPVSV